MIKVTKEVPVEPKVTIETTEYGAQFIAYCLRYYAEFTGGMRAVEGAARRAANALNPGSFVYNSEKIDALFKS